MAGKPKKTQIVRDACMHQVLQPNLNIVLGGKKSKLQHVDFVYTWMVVPFFGFFSRLRGENRTKKSLDMLCIFDWNQSRPSLGLFCLDFLLPTKLLNCMRVARTYLEC
jgi:hypothetical protein